MREKRPFHLPMFFLIVLLGLFLSLGSQSRAYETKNLTMNGSYAGNETYLHSGDVEYWKFTLPSDGYVELRANFECNAFGWALYNADLSTEFFSDGCYEAYPTSPKTMSWSSWFSKGSYVVKIEQISKISDNIEGTVRLYGKFRSAQATDSEPNDSFSSATVLFAGTENGIKGALTKNDDVDFFRIHVPKTGQVSIKLNTGINSQDFVIYNAEREQIFSETVWEGSEESPKLYEYSEALEAGDYYIKIQKGSWYYNTNNGTYYLTYNTSAITSVKLNKKNLTITNRKNAQLTAKVQPDNAVNKTVSWSSSDSDVVSVEKDGSIFAKEPGVAVITAKSTDGTGISDTCTVKVVPAKVSEFYVSGSNQGRNSVVFSWDTVSGADGYRVYKYNAKTKKFTKYCDTAKNTVRVSKLSPETRYVFKVAAYKKSGKTKLLGTASAKVVAYTAPKLLKKPTLTTKKILSRSYQRVNIYLKWKPVSGANGYKVYYKHAGTKKWNILTNQKSRDLTATVYLGKPCYLRITPYRTRNGITTEGASKTILLR